MKKRIVLMIVMLAALLVFWGVGCSSGDDDDDDNDADGGECPDTTLDIAVCDLDAGPFSLTIDNEFYPLAVGDQLILEGEEDGAVVRVEIDVLNQTKDVGGVTTRVVRETETEDGNLVEISWNWFAQAPDGTVCYFGEDVDIYEDGEIVANDGAWMAGDGGAVAGIVMPGDPQVDQAFFQEYWENEAEDMAQITGFGESVIVPAGTFEDTLSMTDYNPLEDCESDDKVYVRGIGLTVDAAAKLLSY